MRGEQQMPVAPEEMSYILSKHFTLAEFIRSNTADYYHIVNIPPEECMPLAVEFCNLILEPVRARFGAVRITSGYRCPELNRQVQGVPQSDHVWNTARVAADFDTPQADLDEVFDWIRLESKLPFDQVIREYGSRVSGDCIHVSYRGAASRRIALVGATHNQSGYTPAEVA